MYRLDHSALRLMAKAGAEHLDMFYFYYDLPDYVISLTVWSPWQCVV